MPRIFIVYYSLYGHVRQLAESMMKGVSAVPGVAVEMFQVPETLPQEVLQKMSAPPKSSDPVITPEKLTEADGILFGIPTRYGSKSAQWQTFIDATGKLWMSGGLDRKFAGTFFSTSSQHGGQETTALTFLTTLAHHGMIYVPLGYKDAPGLLSMDEVAGGSPYGAGTMTKADGSRMPTKLELEVARAQGQRFAEIVSQYIRGASL
ncbi:uncharacterized protein VTP21DRAFT_10473 [Calcarisporiella thermophila]|uniref:uncharacterized protein n=1 Tax=Calcarisporiella thermophila TaxID=911321 RepID=UPI003742E75D